MTIRLIPVMDLAMRLFKTFVVLALVLILFIAGVWFGSKISKRNSSPHEENTVAVVREIQTLSDLVTVKYIVEKVEILDSPPNSTLGQFVQGENRILLLAHGIVKAGIDLKQLKAGDVRVSGDTIRIHLPPAEITDAYLDEQRTKVIDWQRGFLRDFDKDLERTARQNAVADIRRAAQQDGILKEAANRAQLELAVFLNRAGYAHVEFADANWKELPKPSSGELPKF